ncbi:MAG: hypothetical protein ACRC10_02630 [Thermoguttaceae bacterium]
MKTTYLTCCTLLIGMSLISLSSLGCKTTQSQSVFDPFFKSPTVPPPGTGSYSTESGVVVPTENPGVSPYAPATGQPVSSTQPLSQSTSTVAQQNVQQNTSVASQNPIVNSNNLGNSGNSGNSTPAAQTTATPYSSAIPHSGTDVQSGSVQSPVRHAATQAGDHVAIPVASYRSTTGSQGANDFLASNNTRSGRLAPSSASSTIMVTSATTPALLESQPAAVYANRAE